MTKLLSILALSFALHAEDAPKPTVEELTTENERLTKMLNAYAQKYQRCDQELTVMQTLGVQPTQPTQAITRPRPANGAASAGKSDVSPPAK